MATDKCFLRWFDSTLLVMLALSVIYGFELAVFLNTKIIFVRDGIHSVTNYNSTRVGVVIVVVFLIVRNKIECIESDSLIDINKQLQK